MRPSMSTFLPAPLTMVVFSLSIITFLARPSMLSVTFSSLMPRSSEIAWPPVRMAMSCSIALRRSPKPRAFTAAPFRPPRSLLTTSVASAPPSTSSAMMRSGLAGLPNAPRSGHRLGALLDDRGGEHGRGGGAVARLIGGLGGDLAHHLCAHVLELVFQLDFLGDGDAVLGHARGAERFVEHHVAALGAERHLHG